VVSQTCVPAAQSVLVVHVQTLFPVSQVDVAVGQSAGVVQVTASPRVPTQTGCSQLLVMTILRQAEVREGLQIDVSAPLESRAVVASATAQSAAVRVQPTSTHEPGPLESRCVDATQPMKR
jgi:hypothetical protein